MHRREQPHRAKHGGRNRWLRDHGSRETPWASGAVYGMWMVRFRVPTGVRTWQGRERVALRAGTSPKIWDAPGSLHKPRFPSVLPASRENLGEAPHRLIESPRGAQRRKT